MEANYEDRNRGKRSTTKQNYFNLHSLKHQVTGQNRNYGNNNEKIGTETRELTKRRMD